MNDPDHLNMTTREDMRDLGFGGKTAMLDTSDFRPLRRPGDASDDAIADGVADRSGFASREVPQRLARTRKPAQAFDQAYVRAPLETINRFKRFCNEAGLNYGEALDDLMRRSGF
jgi:hypothetical protein